MSVKIAAIAESCFPITPPLIRAEEVVVVREYDEERDKMVVEEMERRCEFGHADNNQPTLVTDLLGDPLCRVRNFPSHVMLVAEYGEEMREVVGVIRGCIKTVTRGKKSPTDFPVYAKLGYILGLRVSPTHRDGSTLWHTWASAPAADENPSRRGPKCPGSKGGELHRTKSRDQRQWQMQSSRAAEQQ